MAFNFDYERIVGDYSDDVERDHDFTDYSAWCDADAAHDALVVIRNCIADELGKLRVQLKARGLSPAEAADAVEYATDAIGDCIEGPVGALLRSMNAYLRGEATRSAKAA